MDAVIARPSLYTRLEELRDEYRAESVLTMSVSAPPVVTQISQDGTITVSEEPAAMIGMTLSGSMVRLLGHPEGYGLRFAVRRGLHSWEHWCQSRHVKPNAPDHRGQPVCGLLMWRVVRDENSVAFAAHELGLRLTQAEAMLGRGMRYVEDQRARWEFLATAS